MFEIKAKDLAARLGEIRTKSGVIKTPALLPVVNPVSQEIPPSEIGEIGFDTIITNAYLIKKYRKTEALEKGVHRLLGFSKPIMTDSGAYQLLMYGDIDITPEEIVYFQERIGSDIAVILDVPTMGVSREEAEKSVQETIENAIESIAHRHRDDILWVLPVQGGTYLDLLSKSAEYTRKLPYHIVAIGSPVPIMERYRYDALMEMIVTAKRIIPDNKPVHLFGAGHPMLFPFIVALGVDMFDSAAYILYAKDDRYMLPSGTMRLEELEVLPCTCPICSKYTADELRKLNKFERVRLLALHNLYVSYSEIKRVRQAIKDGVLWELLEERSRSHPMLYSAFKKIIKNIDYIMEKSPSIKSNPVGIFFYDELSYYRPENLLHHKRLVEKYSKPEKAKVLILMEADYNVKPYNKKGLYTKIRINKEFNEKIHIAFYIPFLGVIPEELAETYPLSQHEIPRPEDISKEVNILTARSIANFIEKQGYCDVLIERPSYYKSLVEELIKILRGKNLEFKLCSEPEITEFADYI